MVVSWLCKIQMVRCMCVSAHMFHVDEQTLLDERAKNLKLERKRQKERCRDARRMEETPVHVDAVQPEHVAEVVTELGEILGMRDGASSNAKAVSWATVIHTVLGDSETEEKGREKEEREEEVQKEKKDVGTGENITDEEDGEKKAGASRSQAPSDLPKSAVRYNNRREIQAVHVREFAYLAAYDREVEKRRETLGSGVEKRLREQGRWTRVSGSEVVRRLGRAVRTVKGFLGMDRWFAERRAREAHRHLRAEVVAYLSLMRKGLLD